MKAYHIMPWVGIIGGAFMAHNADYRAPAVIMAVITVAFTIALAVALYRAMNPND